MSRHVLHSGRRRRLFPRVLANRRPVALSLILCHALFGVPVVARPTEPAGTLDALRGGPLPEPDVTVNRTVPDVEPPPAEPAFSSSPTVEEIFRARVFDEPLLPVGGEPNDEETLALARALLRFHRSGGTDWQPGLGEFLAAYPHTPWRASLLLNIGRLQLRDHAFSAALEMWDTSWTLAKDDTTPNGRAVADAAVADWLALAASVGQIRPAQERLAHLGDRDLTGSAASRVQRVRESIALVIAHPDLATFCAPEALVALLRARAGEDARVPKALEEYRASLDGTSLVEVRELAHDAGLNLRVVRLTDAAAAPVPSVVHLKVRHYATLIERAGDRYRIVDRGQTYWIPWSTLQAEMSGYLLVEAALEAPGWRDASDEEGRSILGSGPQCPDHAAPPGPEPGDKCGCSGGGGGGGGGPMGGGPSPGLASYAFQRVTASLLLYDSPVGYSPPRGPSVPFTLSYHHRDVFQPQVFSYANVGRKWTLGWLRFVKEEPTDFFGVTPPHIWVALPPGGREVFNSADGMTRHFQSGATLTLVSSNPLRYERHLPDGSVEVFGHSDGAPSGQRRVFLTEIIDPQGLSVTLTWDAQFRLLSVTDAIGQVSTLQYADGSDPLKITGITDPFSRQAALTYDAEGRLQSITDVIGLVSGFEYGPEDFVSTLRTPYGATTFRHEPSALNSLYTMRFIEATDPLGGTEHLEFQFSTAALAATAPSNEVPTGFTAWNTSLDAYNTFYWDKLAWDRAPNDLDAATITHWLAAPEFAGWQVYSQPIPHSEKRALEGRVWFAYPGQTTGTEHLVGTWAQPSRVGRLLDDGSSQISETTYNAAGQPLTITDPLGRQMSYVYDTNDRDVLQVRQTSAGLNDSLAAFGGYLAHDRPQSATDGGGGTTTRTYNAAGQVLTSTNPLSETTTHAYDGDGRLLTVTASMSGAVTTFTYDALGRLRTATDSDGYAVTTDYDALDRPIRLSYPDGTYEEMTYSRLDMAVGRDRAGRVTRYFYDALGRLTGTRDPLGRTVGQTWCSCGALDALVDGNGNRTSWVRDVRGRVTQEVRANGSGSTYTYGPASGRLLTVTDAKQQVTTYSYALDDAVLGMTFTNAAVATPSVSFTYEAGYSRMATMVDGTGTTAYTHVSAGTAGAGQVASVDGPLANDTITYTYDVLGRATNRDINGTGVTWGFDALGRVTSEINVLGTFTYGYDGVTPRLASVTYPNGQTSAYSYYGATADRRLETIHHKYPGGATLSKFDYTYDAVGNILTWLQQADSDPPVLWVYGYDAADQLTSAVEGTTGQSPTELASYRYGYDAAANRTFEEIDDQITLATYDSMNRLLAHVPGGPLAIEGLVNEAATVTIEGVPATGDGAGGVPRNSARFGRDKHAHHRGDGCIGECPDANVRGVRVWTGKIVRS